MTEENTNEPRRFRLDELFTEEELRKAAAIFAAPRIAGGPSTVSRIEDEVVRPIIDRINRVTGQENNARYMAYALEYAFTQFLTKTGESKL